MREDQRNQRIGAGSSSLARGAAANIPLAVSALTYGGVLGVLSAQKGVTWAEMSAMNILMFAGSAQFVMVDMWQDPLSAAAIAMAVFIINLRYLLIGASLQPVFSGCSLWQKACFMHLVADENWAVTIAEHRKSGTDPFFLFGGGLLLLCAWSSGTLGGNLLGSFIEHPETYALDFAFTAVFAALTLSLWRGKGDALAWTVAVILALVCEKFLPGKWYIVAGGIGGAAVSAVMTPKKKVGMMEPRLFIENGPAAIIVASVITYAFRLGGLLLADRLPGAGPLRRFLDALPGTILVSLVVPSALHAGWQGMVGVGACLLVYLRIKNLLVIMVTGILTVYLLRLFG